MKIKYFAASILVAIGLWGCGAETEQAQPVGGSSGQELAENQVLRWGNGAEPGSLDPHRTQGVPGSNIGRDLFEGLMSEAPDGDRHSWRGRVLGNQRRRQDVPLFPAPRGALVQRRSGHRGRFRLQPAAQPGSCDAVELHVHSQSDPERRGGGGGAATHN